MTHFQVPSLDASEGKSRQHPQLVFGIKMPKQTGAAIPEILTSFRAFPSPSLLERLISEPGGELALQEGLGCLLAGVTCCWVRRGQGLRDLGHLWMAGMVRRSLFPQGMEGGDGWDGNEITVLSWSRMRG